jgi:hypothetical protein
MMLGGILGVGEGMESRRPAVLSRFVPEGSVAKVIWLGDGWRSGHFYSHISLLQRTRKSEGSRTITYSQTDWMVVRRGVRSTSARSPLWSTDGDGV